MGRFLAFVSDQAIAAAMTAVSDEVMLRTAFVLEHKDRLDHAIGLLPEGRLTSIMRSASALDLWPEALDLLDHLSIEQLGPIADVVAEQDADVIERLVAAVSGSGIWESLLPVVGMMSDSHRPLLAARSPFHDPTILVEIIRAAQASNLWRDLIPLIDALPEDARETAANLVGDQDETTILNVLDTSVAHGLWPILVPLVGIMTLERRRRLAGMASIIHLADTAGLRAELDAALAVEPSAQA